jgi:RNA polymerase sigma-70 factor (ECF subfamily)
VVWVVPVRRAGDSDDMAVTTSDSAALGNGFDQVVLPHLDAGYRLARWIVRNEHDAEDIVQEASLRALRYFGTFTGGNGRAWFLRIVRNTCSSRLTHGLREPADLFDEQQHRDERPSSSPETLLIRTDDARRLEQVLGALSPRGRELIRLRELEGLSYREIADALEIPIGTVMSGLARARRTLQSHSRGH